MLDDIHVFIFILFSKNFSIGLFNRIWNHPVSLKAFEGRKPYSIENEIERYCWKISFYYQVKILPDLNRLVLPLKDAQNIYFFISTPKEYRTKLLLIQDARTQVCVRDTQVWRIGLARVVLSVYFLSVSMTGCKDPSVCAGYASMKNWAC